MDDSEKLTRPDLETTTGESGPRGDGPIKRALDRFVSGTVDVTSGIMLLLLAVVCWMAIGRSVFNIGQPWLDELARYLQIWLVYLAAFALTLRGDHITMDAVYLRMPGRVRYGVRLATGVITLAASLVTGYYAYQQALTVWVQGETSPSGVLPAILGYASLPIGFGLIAVASVYYLVYTAPEDDATIADEETEYEFS